MADESEKIDIEQYNTLTSIGLVGETEFTELLKSYSPEKLTTFIQSANLDDLENVWENFTIIYHKMRFVIERQKKARGKKKTIEEIRDRDRIKVQSKDKENKSKPAVGRPAVIYDPDPKLNKFIKECLKSGMTEAMARKLFLMEV